MTLQHGESRLDRVEVVLVPGVEVMAQARRYVRSFMQSLGAQSETTEGMVQLVAELLGPGTVPVNLALEEVPTAVRLSIQPGSPADYAVVQWWRAQHPLGTGPWRLYVSRLSDDWQERPHLGGVLITALIRDRLSTTAPASANIVERPP
jgi:hypothetical protein